ncbi:Laa2p [Lachancea thermotolerans CBS 6340]|uniref:KLTH0E07524p n=1 Tax=Lachancea thermotolerans (strain ATCC 56472 / CBS 6340 / NRRL Y-8284) TaxID=559295 RepID=C5DHV8_LACTC|nr:KLTH0E07524p [Lachancea thermotolerans CBS 6340]CAR23369.1 KLTH0E07524p [Lachancea thermotolerans CBS 6340]
MSDSDSDSDFGDFAGVPEEESPVPEILSPVEQLDRALGQREEIQYVNQPHSLDELIKGERPRVVYEHLVLLETQLRPFSWRNSKLRSLLLQTLQIADEPELPKAHKPLDSFLYSQLEPRLGEEGLDYAAFLSRVCGDKFSANNKSPVQKIESLEAKDLEQLDTEALRRTHDELLDAVLAVCQEIGGTAAVRSELEADKSMYEGLVTNLVGHTQRLRRDEIADFNKKHRRGSKYGKFKWVR